VQQISDFVRGFSLEATRPSVVDIEQLAAIAPAGTHVYVSAVPTRPAAEAIESAALLRRAGLEPVPHVAARNFASALALDDFLARLAGEAAVTRVLVIAGDRDHSAGEFTQALDIIRSGLLQRRGIIEIGIAGHPEGHPRIAQPELERALADKRAAAAQAELGLHIATQFGFDHVPMVDWIANLRRVGVQDPIRIGLAGPTSVATLLRFAQRCGVRASTLGLARQAGLMRHLLGHTTPELLVRALAAASAAGQLGDVATHFFSFGGLVAAAQWAMAALEGRMDIGDAGELRAGSPPA
jgi:methylenetetrahydrofolate reductase (NADPH)